MDYEQKFQDFSSLVLREASDQKMKIFKDVKEKITQAQDKTKNEFIKSAEQELKIETEKTVRQKNEELSKTAMESRKVIIQKREELIGKMYVSVLKRVQEFTKSNEYIDLLFSKIKNAKDEIKDENVVVYLGDHDKELLDKIASTAKVKVEIDETITIGGCKVVSIEKKMFVDSTLQKKLEEEFLCFDKLVIRN